MKQFGLLWLVFSLILVGTQAQDARPGSDSIGDPLFNGLGNGGYDVLHYTLDMRWDDEREQLNADVTIEARALHNLSRFNLDFVGYEIDALRVNGAAATFRRAGSELIITPPAFIPAAERFVATVSYNGNPSPLRFGPLELGWRETEDEIYVVSEPLGAQSWYPANDHPLDKATYTFRITVDKPLVVAANGLLQATIDNGATLTYIWEASDPTASYLTTVNIGEFVIDEALSSSGIPIRHYYANQALLKEFKPINDLTNEMLQFYTERLGPYPFEAFGTVIIPEFRNGLETQTLSVIGAPVMSQQTLAHELAHQ